MNRTCTIFLWIALAAHSVFTLPTSVLAQQTPAAGRPAGVNVLLKNGNLILGTGFRMDGATLLVTQQVGTGNGEIGYPLTGIDKVEFPEPAQLANAQALLAQSKDGDALAQIEPIVAYYSPLRAVPGNWWLPAVLVKLDALGNLKREQEVDALLAEVARLPNNPTAADAVQLRIAEAMVRRGSAEKAGKTFDDIIKANSDDAAVARAWIGKGTLCLGKREYEPALLAYLRIPVFYPDNRRQLSDALLGCGRAFVGLDDHDRARETFQQIVSDDPSSQAAKEARAAVEALPAAKPSASP